MGFQSLDTMSWIEPKTDWVGTDYVNVADYNRIRNNLLYLNDKVNGLFPPEVTADLGEEKTVSDYYYASEFNAFEDLLESINNRAYRYDIGTKQTFRQLGRFIDSTELNRIEKACLRLYQMVEQIEKMSRRTAFRAGGTDFVDSGIVEDEYSLISTGKPVGLHGDM